MDKPFKALLLTKTEHGHQAALTDMPQSALMEGDTLVRISHSTINYKDGLAVTGKAPIARKYPMIAGIDLAGVVAETTDSRFKPGDAVLVNGWGLSESHFGGFAEVARVKGDWLVPVPKGMTAAQTMAVGTAGYTSMLAVMALEEHGLTPAAGSVLVTGAAGGVGSVAIALLKQLGFHVTASTGRMEEADYLKHLGANEVIARTELSGEGRPINKERWAGVVDSVGSRTLVNAISHLKYGGVAAACGLAQGMDLPGSVAPFILRGTVLAGIDSVMCPRPRRLKAWERLARDLDHTLLASMTQTIGLSEVIARAPAILAGQVRGRIVVDIAQ